MTNREKINFINDLITFWEEDTCFMSSIETKHPAFTIVKKMTERE